MSGAQSTLPDSVSELGQQIFDIANRGANKYRKEAALQRLSRLRGVIQAGFADEKIISLAPGLSDLFEAIDLDLAFLEGQIRSFAP